MFEACPSEDHWDLIFPLQLLASGISLAPSSRCQPQPDHRPQLTWCLALHPSHQTDQCLNLVKACPTQSKKRRLSVTCLRSPLSKKWKPLARTLREVQQEAFSKDSEVVKVARQTYHKTHRAMFQQEGSYDLTSYSGGVLPLPQVHWELPDTYWAWLAWVLQIEGFK